VLYQGRVVQFDAKAGEGEAVFSMNEFTFAHLVFSRKNLSGKYREPMEGDEVEGNIHLHLGSKPTVRISGPLRLLSRQRGQADWANAS